MTFRPGPPVPLAATESLTVLAVAKGLYGDLMVSDFAGVRTLWCGQQCQGSVYLEPAFASGSVRLSPGPVPEAGYAIGWLVAGLQHQQGTMLMVGMGPGSGVAALLYHFPGLSVVVVEIDCDVIRLARAHFPLIDHYVAAGRLRIVNADISFFIRSHASSRWSAILMDAYQTDTNLYCPRQLLTDLRPTSDCLWLNLLDSIDGPRMRALVGLLRQTGWNLGQALPISTCAGRAEFHSGNILIGTEPLSRTQALAFKPFADLAHEHAATARWVYAAMIRRSFPLAAR